MNLLRPFFELDDFLLDRIAQPAVDWLSKRWGVDFVKLGLGFGYLGMAADLAISVAIFMHRDVLSITLGGMLFLLSLVWVPLLRVWSRNVSRSQMNSNRSSGFFLRTYFLWNFVILVAVPPLTFGDLNRAAMTVALYILACRKPPPKAQPVFSKALAPAPT